MGMGREALELVEWREDERCARLLSCRGAEGVKVASR